MLTSKECIEKWGNPTPANEPHYMTLWPVPKDIQDAFKHVRFSAAGTVGFPTKIYTNKAMVAHLEQSLRNIIVRGLTPQLKTWDGSFFVRTKRGQYSPSLHSWGAAVDVNAFENAFGAVPKISDELCRCFIDAGLDSGKYWSKPDGMHFQLTSI